MIDTIPRLTIPERAAAVAGRRATICCARLGVAADDTWSTRRPHPRAGLSCKSPLPKERIPMWPARGGLGAKEKNGRRAAPGRDPLGMFRGPGI